MNIGKTLFFNLASLLLLCCPRVWAQVTYDVKKVNERVYIFTELWDAPANGNCGIVIGNDQVLLINSMMLGSAPDLEREIQKITDLPIRFVINSDSDTYNHHANTYFADKGATIVSHRQMRHETAYHQILFDELISIPIGDEVVTAYHTPSHTLDHIDIYLERSNVLFMGDAFQPHWLTYMGPNGLNGVLNGIDRAISLSDEKTLIVPGNTSKHPKQYFGTKKHLLRNKEIYIQVNNRISQLYQKGWNVDDMVSDKVLNNIVRQLEAYHTMKPYLKYVIEEALEVSFDTKTE